MGVFRHQIEVGSPDRTRFEPVDAVVDTAASFTTLPRSLLERLGVPPHDPRGFLIAEGQRVELEVGRAWIRVDGQMEMAVVCFGRDDSLPLLGATTLQLLSLAVDPVHERLVPAENYLLVQVLP